MLYPRKASYAFCASGPGAVTPDIGITIDSSPKNCNSDCAAMLTKYPEINYSGLVQFGFKVTCFCLTGFSATKTRQTCFQCALSGGLLDETCGTGISTNGYVSTFAVSPVGNGNGAPPGPSTSTTTSCDTVETSAVSDILTFSTDAPASTKGSSNSTQPIGDGNSSNSGIVIGITLGLLLVVAVAGGLIYAYYHSRKTSAMNQSEEGDSSVTLGEDTVSDSAPPPTSSSTLIDSHQPVGLYKALKGCDGKVPGMLSFKKGDLIEVFKKFEDSDETKWWLGRVQGAEDRLYWVAPSMLCKNGSSGQHATCVIL
ncbi:hypothetical protein BDR26DRAFT_137267 [Obelidium mucronatum]|nr:hypothetical protein BDR26DRAFT_137267 [Obelidium mucronatum]